MQDMTPSLAVVADWDASLRAVDDFLGTGDVDRARMQVKQLLHSSEHSLSELNRAHALLRLAYCDLLSSKTSRAYEAARSAASMFHEANSAADEVSATALVALCAARLGRSVESVETALAAVYLAEDQPKGSWSARAHLSLAVAYAWAQSFAKAELAFETALQLAESSGQRHAKFEVQTERALLLLFRHAVDGRRPPPTETLKQLLGPLNPKDELATSERLELLTPGIGPTLAWMRSTQRQLLDCWRGRPEDVRAESRAADVTQHDAAGRGWLHAFDLWAQVEESLRVGDADEAARLAREMRSAAELAEHEPLACLAHLLASECHLRGGHLDLAFSEMQALAKRERTLRATDLDNRTNVVAASLSARRASHTIKALMEQSQELERLAFEDALTGIANVRRFQQKLTEWTAASADTGTPLSAAVIDVDRFKQVNDNFSHDIGDAVLRTLATLMTRHVREGDLPARMGGDEFSILFRNADEAAARQVCERLEASVRAHTWSELAHGLAVSISVGVVQARSGDTPKILVHRSDEAMYRRKRARGRDELVQSEQDVDVPELLLERIARWLEGVKRLVIFVGAKNSTGAESTNMNVSSWSAAQRQRYAHVDGLRADPKGFHEFWTDLSRRTAKDEPSDAYRDLVELARRSPSTTFVTERIDGLLSKAGAGHVLELYGSAHRYRCAVCNAVHPVQADSHCMACNDGDGAIRPDIVLLGEPTDNRLFAGAELATKRADVVLVVDCDATTFPSSSILEKAKGRGAKVVMIGAGPQSRLAVSDVNLRASASHVLPLLLSRLREGRVQVGRGSNLSDDGFAAMCYLAGHGTDHLGRTLEQTLSWVNWEIERQFDSTQWQFPLMTTSNICPEAPVPTRQDFELLAADKSVVTGMRRAFERMLKFYGFEWQAGEVRKALDWEDRFAYWALVPSHNDLRISRILGAMALCGLQSEATGFLAALEVEVLHYRREAAVRPLTFWRQAANRW